MNKPRPGRPRALSAKERREIVRQVVKNPFASAPTLSSHIAPLSGKIVYAQTVRNVFFIVHNLLLEPQERSHSLSRSDWNSLKRMWTSP